MGTALERCANSIEALEEEKKEPPQLLVPLTHPTMADAVFASLGSGLRFKRQVRLSPSGRPRLIGSHSGRTFGNARFCRHCIAVQVLAQHSIPAVPCRHFMAFFAL